MVTEQLLAPKTMRRPRGQRRAGGGARHGRQAAVDAYEAALPDDGAGRGRRASPRTSSASGRPSSPGTAARTSPTTRRSRVEREVAAGSGDVRRPVRRDPGDAGVPAGRGRRRATCSGDQRWPWTAHFEAFVAPFDTGSDRSRPRPATTASSSTACTARAGAARFPTTSNRGRSRSAPWSGITVEDLRLEDDRTVSFKVGPRRVQIGRRPGRRPGRRARHRGRDRADRLPGLLRIAVAFIRLPADRLSRPGSAGRRLEARVVLLHLQLPARGSMPATPPRRLGHDPRRRRLRPRDPGRPRRRPLGHVTRSLRRGEHAFVEAGRVTDAFGNFNGAGRRDLPWPPRARSGPGPGPGLQPGACAT